MNLRDVGQAGQAGSYSFLDVTLDVAAERLTRGGIEIRLRPKSFQVLRYLVERGGRLVTREELLNAIWPDVAVTDESITKCIADVRAALNDHSQQTIRTVARRGYVFAAPVTRTVEFPRSTDHQHDHVLPSIGLGGRPKPHPIEPSKSVHALRALRQPAVIVGLLIAAASIASVVILTARRVPSGILVLPEYTPLTNFTDSAYAPALSPDGRMLAFIRGDRGTVGGSGDIFIKLLPDGEPVQLTHDGKHKMAPSFTPDGQRIAFAYTAPMTEPKNWNTWTVSVFGGQPQLMLSNASGLMWLPGATSPRVVFSEVGTGVHMSIVSSAENRIGSQVVYAPRAIDGMAHRSYPSPDGKHLLIVEMEIGWTPCRLASLDAASGAAVRPVGPSPGQCASAAWSPDGKWMYLSVNTGDGYHVWRQRFPDGAPEQVTFGATEEHDIAFAPDGRSFVASVGTRQSTLWLRDAYGERQITSEGYASLPRLSPDGKKLYYLQRSKFNRRYVSGELWVADLESGGRQHLFPEFLFADFRLSDDGKRILFVALAADGKSSVWMASLDGRSAPSRVSTLNAIRAYFGSAGELIVFATESDGTRVLYRMREDGSQQHRALPYPLISVYDVSPGGSAVAAWRGAAVEIIPLDERQPMIANAVCAASGGENAGTTPPCVSWSRDGRYLNLYDRRVGQVYSVPIPSGRDVPDLPAGGVASEAQGAALPGARVIPERTAFLSNDPDTYSFFRVTNHLNIYRIGVP